MVEPNNNPIVHVNFQARIPGERPTDESINREYMLVDSMAEVPIVGDYVTFDNKGEEEIPYLVVDRLIEFKYSSKIDSWAKDITVILEMKDHETYLKLVKL